ncbi:MBL fold metallo-hydrolase [Rhizorhabdus dicambivorans]|nr:MBL fold metallo-hydrolase [Rhizorhabdus dicambivorans]
MRVLVAAAGLTLAFPGAQAYGEGGAGLHRSMLKVVPLGDGAHVVTGGITNTGFVVGKDGVVVIDAQMLDADAVAMQREIRARTDLPLRAIILTHSDPDHINGLPAWPRGIMVIAQENTLSEMTDTVAGKQFYARPQPPVPADLKSYLPTELVRHSRTLTVGGISVVLTHLAAGHTDGDLVAWFPAQRVAFVGDLLTGGDPNLPDRGPYPVINLEKFGSSAGWLKVMKAALALNARVYVGGHGSAQVDRDQLKAMILATERRRDEVEKLFKAGKQLSEIRAILKDPPPSPPLFFPTFVEIVYAELLRA